jgi:hypothetical protein
MLQIELTLHSMESQFDLIAADQPAQNPPMQDRSVASICWNIGAMLRPEVLEKPRLSVGSDGRVTVRVNVGKP